MLLVIIRFANLYLISRPPQVQHPSRERYSLLNGGLRTLTFERLCAHACTVQGAFRIAV
jgi:hypothetical protein